MNKKEEAEEATQVVHKISLTCVAMGDQQFTYDAVAGEESSQVVLTIFSLQRSSDL
jgi:hypothetical protein